MLANFVTSRRVAGTSRDDTELDIIQLTEGDNCSISDPVRMIASHMHMCLSSYIDPGYTVNSIMKLLLHNGVYRLVTTSDENQVYVIVNRQKKKYQYDIYGSYAVRHVFMIDQFDSDDVVYLASEHLVNPEPSCDLIERCYRPYFEDPVAATKYCLRMMHEYKPQHGAESSGYRVSVVRRSDIDVSSWYKKNQQAAKYIFKYELDQEDYRYIVKIDDVLLAVLADAYEDLPDDKKAIVDHGIYGVIRDFIPVESSYALDEAIMHVTGKDLHVLVNSSIALALSEAQNESTFQAIHDALGPNDYRVGMITDDIYNAHSGQGYIMFSKDGQLGWFPESDIFFNTWDKMKETPYYGKLMPNENDTLYCFREFHPEMFVDRVPTQVELDKYRSDYKAFVAEQRRQHPELRYEDRGGLMFACGDWYARGVVNDKVYKNTAFPASYCDYTFSDDECRTLLSGEELVIEHYTSKMGIDTTIRGRLKDISTEYDDGPNICFCRTDIGTKLRFSLNAEFGIEEPGIPSSS